MNYTDAHIASLDKGVMIYAGTRSEGVMGSISITLTHEQFMGKLKQWLRTMPMEQRQMTIDELVATTLRTLE